MQVLRLISVIILLFLSSCSYFEFTKDNSAPPNQLNLLQVMIKSKLKLLRLYGVLKLVLVMPANI